MPLRSLILYLLLLIFSVNVLAQTEAPSVHASPISLKSESQSKISSLSQIVKSINLSEKKISEHSESLKNSESKRIKEDLENKIKEESNQVASLKNNFNIIVTGVDSDISEDSSSGAKIDWANELEELLSPLISEIKKLTSRPRELDRLHRKKAALIDQGKKETIAINNISELLKESKNTKVKLALEDLLEDWNSKKTETKTELSITDQKLIQLDSEKTDLGKSIRELPNIFFRSRGKNLLLAFLATLIFWWGVRRAYNKFTHLEVITKRDSAAFRRALNLLYLSFSGSGSLLIFILVLFILGDWVLLILSLLLVLGIVWSSKQALPQFWSQGAMLLNIGPVREKERIYYNDILWEVNSLNLYSILKNPYINPSTLRVPLSDLLPLRSRKEAPKEPWFPSKEGDWVLVGDNALARVINQTPSQVVLVKLGGSRITYDIPSYIGANPLNLSGGFRISKTFGLDYSVQREITTSIPETIKAYLLEKLLEKLKEDEFRLTVELAEAGSSSLDLVIILDCVGELGSQYLSLQRLIVKHCVDVCNINKWEIPFNQMTVHMKQ